MKSESSEKIFEWVENWKDLVDFDVIPVLYSTEASNAASETE